MIESFGHLNPMNNGLNDEKFNFFSLFLQATKDE